MKNKIVSIILTLFLLLPVSVQAVEDNALTVSEPQTVEEVAQTQLLDEDSPQEVIADTEKESPYKQPFSKKKLVKKFLMAMFAVIVSSLALYLGLSMYNKLRNNIKSVVKTPEGETSLKTPDDMESAVRTFLEKTKW